MQKSGLADDALLNAVAEMERGLIDADLGGGIFKNALRYLIVVKVAVCAR
jgi:hypothetical protein